MSNKSSDFWYFSRTERNATIMLVVMVVILFLLPAIFRSLPTDLTQLDTAAFEAAIRELEKAQPETTETDAVVAGVFYFDPNVADEEILNNLGLPPATVSTMLNYRKKGGRFRQADDLSRIYNLSAEDFERLRPYVRIAAPAGNFETAKPAPEQETALFSFDPNTAGLEALLRLGLGKKTAANLIRYREKGGRFRQPADLQKIYSLTPEDYQRLEPYIQIATTGAGEAAQIAETREAESPQEMPEPYDSPAPIMIDINRAAAEEWQLLRGVGPVLSGRIVKFRDKLGGFVSIEQVAETFGLPDSTFQAIKGQLQFSPLQQKLPINTIDLEALKAHPYLKWQQAKVIVAYRQEHGPFKDLEDLKKVRALPEELIDRIAPYLEF